jgi:NAD(P)-dependent dehydrogenase (short-subunit alcohol dehydrogenase family)
MNRLQNKTIVITGAAGGIGAAMARRFAAEGANLALSDLSEEGLAALAAEISPRHTLVLPADVSVPDQMQTLVARAVERFGGLDGMMANAGIEGVVAPVTQLSAEDFDRVYAVNVRGAFLSIKYAAPAIAARGGGAIVVTSSIAGLIGSPGLSAYVSSKHAVMGLVKSASIELAPLGIRVVAINPGPIENRMMRSIEEQAAPGAAERVKQGFEAQVPLHRYGRNEEIAALAAFLVSDDASYCTGAAFVADGGFTAQ